MNLHALATRTRLATVAFRAMLGVAVALPASGAGAQPTAGKTRTPIYKTQTDLAFQQPSGRILAIRELSDGRLLVIEGSNRALFLVDQKGERASQRGRQGDGPGEYRSPAELFDIGTDSTLVHDAATRKWLLLRGDQFLNLTEAMQSLRLRVNSGIVGINGLDRQGNVLQLIGSRPRPEFVRRLGKNWPPFNDSLALLLHRPNGVSDTIAHLSGQFLGVTEKQTVINGRNERFVDMLNPLQTHDQAIMFADGTVAIAYTNPYRVDWRLPNGEWRRGAAFDMARVPVTEAIRRRSAESIMRDDEDRAIFNARDFAMWPASIPPFTRGALVAGQDGKLYIARTTIDGSETPHVDVIERFSGLRYTLELPKASRIVGASSRGVYIVQKNAEEEEQLLRLRITNRSP